MYKILVINPGSTSTKVAVYNDLNCIFKQNITHSKDELAQFPTIVQQRYYRRKCIEKVLEEADISVSDMSIIIGRGGLVRSLESGVYEVTDVLKNDLEQGVQGQHASNLGGLIAADIADEIENVHAYIADPPIVDEMQEVAKVSGLPEMPNRSLFHALNQKSVARNYAASIHSNYENLRLIVAHLGGGITVGAHLYGKVIDVNDGLDGTGPFSPERAGTLPSGKIVELCFSGNYSQETMKKKLVGNGGLMAHFGTDQVQDIRYKALAGDKRAKLVLDAMGYTVAKTIGSMAVVLDGNVDAIIMTGGVAHDKILMDYIIKKVSFIATVVVIPGEDEMNALAENAFNVLSRKVSVKPYPHHSI